MNHQLAECLLVFYSQVLNIDCALENGEEICQQGWADLKYDGFNRREAIKLRYQKRRGPR